MSSNISHDNTAPPTHLRTPWMLPAGLILFLAAVVGTAIWDWRWLLTGLGVLVALGTVYEAFANERLARQHPGKMIDVGGYRLHMYSVGEGGPTVVLETGLGSPGIYWATVQAELAKTHRVISYDRAGQGWSDPSPHPRTGKQMAQELHTLLERAGIAGTLVLVGHSLGGLLVREYAALYPDQVAGMVLVDSSHEDYEQLLPPEGQATERADVTKLQKLLKLTATLAPVGLTRLLAPVLLSAPDGLTPEQRRLRLGLFARRRHLRSSLALAQAFLPALLPEGQTLKPDLRHMPLVVLEASTYMHPGYEELAGRSTQGELRVVATGHTVHAERPDLVIDAIRTVLERVG